MRKIDLAWIGGLFDGEGCIILKLCKPQPKYGQVSPVWKVDCVISMTHKPTIDKLHKLLPGTRSRSHRDKQKFKNRRHKNLWNIEWISLRGWRFLKLITPYLTTKREEAELVLKVVNARYEAGNTYMTKEQKKKYAKAAIKLNQLKQRRYDV